MPRAAGPSHATVSAAFATQLNLLVEWLASLPQEQRRRVPFSEQPAGEVGLDELVGLLAFVRDLHDEVPDNPPPYHPAALAAATRELAGRLAAAAPGRSVEVRIPPYAAVQCVAGPRHTRGTPGSVVETDPLTWFDLATGRLTWQAALAEGRLRASGERTDLSEHLPLRA
jgi:hypothetical protein